MYDYRHTTYPFPASEKDLSMAHLHFEETEASNGGHYFIVFFQPKKAVEEIQGVHGRNDLVDRLGGVEVWGPLFLVRCVFGPPLDGEYPNFIFLDMPERQEDCPERVQAFLNGTAGTINIPDVM